MAMVTALDASVAVALYKNEPSAEAWFEILRKNRETGLIVICEVTLAETSALFENERETISFFQDLGAEYDPISSRTAILAGKIFKEYRRAGGPRGHLLPDFLIGAHALGQCDQLAAADRGYLRRYFPRLKVISPN